MREELEGNAIGKARAERASRRKMVSHRPSLVRVWCYCVTKRAARVALCA